MLEKVREKPRYVPACTSSKVSVSWMEAPLSTRVNLRNDWQSSRLDFHRIRVPTRAITRQRRHGKALIVFFQKKRAIEETIALVFLVCTYTLHWARLAIAESSISDTNMQGVKLSLDDGKVIRKSVLSGGALANQRPVHALEYSFAH